ncbi:pectate lyase [Rhizoctonia solani]|uniref:pectate lyase n=1 Tax=Rhizoctonia solani TaxID=456999 RepID=A0A8H8P1Y0_9AGAM|nr:pectate lyase [Rhizoctonia solani]QRW22875.1 pectate lyase [Rhizoctonia solani]
MKFTSSFTVLAVAIQLVVASPTVVRRASTSDVATIGYAALGKTTGGSGGSTVTVTSLDELTDAVSDDTAKIVVISGTISGNTVVKVGSNKSIVGASGATLAGVGLRVLNVENVIIRNLKVSKVLAEAGDAIGIQASSKVWVDHLDLSSDQDHDKDYYDGLLDITHGSTYVSVTNSVLHDHWKSSLVGHSDSNEDEDKAITVTYALNKWYNLNSRLPSFRFGTGHIFNNYYYDSSDGINTRVGAQLLVENNVFSGLKKPLYSTDSGYAVATGNDFGDGENTAEAGTFSTAPYDYDLLDASAVVAAVSSAGATLSF